MPQMIPLVRGGRLRALGVTTAHRAAAAPDIPTIAESGLPGFQSVQWYGLFAPAHTPRDIIDRLNKETIAMLHARQNRERLAGDGAEVVGSSPDGFAVFYHAEIAKWAKVARLPEYSRSDGRALGRGLYRGATLDQIKVSSAAALKNSRTPYG